MTEISSTFTTTPSSVMRSYRACHRAVYVIVLPIAILSIVIGIVDNAVGWIAWGVGGPVILEVSARVQLRPYLSGNRTVTVTITGNEYRTIGQDRATARPWTAFTGVRRVGRFWVLRLSATAAMALPAHALDPAQTRQFEALMQQKGLLSGRRSYRVHEESRRGESHPPALAEPGVNLSAHRAPIVQPSGRTPNRQWANRPGWRLAMPAMNLRARPGRRRKRLYFRMAHLTSVSLKWRKTGYNMDL